MTKLVKTVAVLGVVAALAACSTGPAQQESVVHGDKTFTRAQSK